MTNEIKEILNELKSMFEISELEEQVNNINKIKNSITNLQNEIFDLKDTIQNKNDCIGAYECIIEDRDKRIDKAVELLKEAGSYDEKTQIFCDDVWEELPELLNILRGDE